MSYTLATQTELCEEIKKSRFIVNAAPVTTATQAMEFIEAISDPTATHNCWAWKIGQQYRFNDDGEPTSTAGRPILSAIEGQNCDQIVVVVTRYFGGIKLGTGGLIRAYGGTASHCLQQAELIELIPRITLTFHCHYAEWAIIENRLKDLDTLIEELQFDANGVNVTIAITSGNVPLLQKMVSDLTRGRVLIAI